MYLWLSGNIRFKGDSITNFNKNTASNWGGAICMYNNSNLSFEGNSFTQFSINSAALGEAVYLKALAINVFKGTQLQCLIIILYYIEVEPFTLLIMQIYILKGTL